MYVSFFVLALSLSDISIFTHNISMCLQVSWVPHEYLSSISRGLLLHFLKSGVRVTLETESKIATKDSVIGEDIAEAVLGVDEDGKRGIESSFQLGPPKADPEAREKIPGAWTVSES